MELVIAMSAEQIRIKTLSNISLGEIHRAWVRGFGDYSVKMDYTAEVLGFLFKQNGVVFDLSVGLFDRDELVGFWLNAMRLVDGLKIAYNSGTAIWPERRGQGFGKLLASRSDEVLKEAGASEQTLEVLVDNKRAYDLYQSSGFEIARKVICYTTNSPTFKDMSPFDGVEISEETFASEQIKSLPNPEKRPSWQNTFESVLNVCGLVRIIRVSRGSDVIGYSLFRPQTGRIIQIGFKDEFWDSPLPSIILNKTCSAMKGLSIVAVNIDESADKTISLFLRHGFEIMAQQYEMKKSFSRSGRQIKAKGR